MVGPGGLLLVVSNLFAIPTLVLLLGWKKVNNYTWMRNISAGSHTEEHSWRCCYSKAGWTLLFNALLLDRLAGLCTNKQTTSSYSICGGLKTAQLTDWNRLQG
jgi:hypothetical protein